MGLANFVELGRKFGTLTFANPDQCDFADVVALIIEQVRKLLFGKRNIAAAKSKHRAQANMSRRIGEAGEGLLAKGWFGKPVNCRRPDERVGIFKRE